MDVNAHNQMNVRLENAQKVFANQHAMRLAVIVISQQIVLLMFASKIYVNHHVLLCSLMDFTRINVNAT